MKGLRFLGNSKLELTDLPDPVVGERDVLCRVKTSAICGSEMAHTCVRDGNQSLEHHTR